ncbi:MAG: glycine--tRNA ligase [Candidatus Methanospirareceae archaeon]
MREDKVMELLRRRGFLWPAFEIYGGVAGFYDYGPLGAMLKRNIEAEWRAFYTIGEGFYEIETANIAPMEVFEASGHLKSFKDRAVACKKCKAIFREDLLDGSGRCPECKGELEYAGEFNLMFQTRIGIKEEGYLRPETAQGMFINFHRLLRFNRNKLPFGIIQIGRVYRNEISPRQSVIRLREFTVAEAEVFVEEREKNEHPRFEEVKGEVLKLVPRGEGRGGGNNGKEMEEVLEEAVRKGIIANEYMAYHMAKAREFLEKIGIPSERMRFRQHERDEMAHYARDCWDVEFFSERFGWIEIVGIADRGDYDLRAHSAFSKADMSVLIEEGDRKEKIIPHVIEPSYGIDRIVYAVLESAFYEEVVGKEERRVLRLKKEIAPIRAAVLPLLTRGELKEKAREIFRELKLSSSLFIEYDESGSIGRRYRRQDEIGTPYCITVDYETLEKGTVTIRDRDTMEQIRVPIGEIKDAIS